MHTQTQPLTRRPAGEVAELRAALADLRAQVSVHMSDATAVSLRSLAQSCSEADALLARARP